jgi:hypothetical protein
MITTVKLTSLERMVCGMVGLARNSSAKDKGWSLREREPGRKDLGIESDIVGCYGEFALARATGLNWNPVVGRLDTDRGDVGRFQVKAVLNINDSLLIRDTDPKGFIYVLCWLSDPTTVEIVGWIDGADGMSDCYWDKRMPRPCYKIPRLNLHPMDTLKL